jgi:FlaA1/EpsC-like NDP-sugar epimerase
VHLNPSRIELKLVTVIGDIVDESTVKQVFATHRLDRVFHAVAYKHVPMNGSRLDRQRV